MSAPKESREDQLVYETLNVSDEELTQDAMEKGFQTREAEMNLAKLVSEIQSKTDV